MESSRNFLGNCGHLNDSSMMVSLLDARRLKISLKGRPRRLCFCIVNQKNFLWILKWTSLKYFPINWFCQRLLWSVMVLALPASRSCRKPGDCGSGHLSHDQDSPTLSPGKKTFVEYLHLTFLLIPWEVKRVRRIIWPHSWHAFASYLRSAGHNVRIRLVVEVQSLSASTCLLVARAGRTPGLRLQCCVCAPAGQQHSAPQPRKLRQGGFLLLAFPIQPQACDSVISDES